MKRIIYLIIIVSIIWIQVSYAEVKLFRYTDKVSGEEQGICYSDKDGNSSIKNPDWNTEEIQEKDKDYYIEFQKQQLKQKRQEKENILNQKKNKAKSKLKSLGLTDEEIETIIK